MLQVTKVRCQRLLGASFLYHPGDRCHSLHVGRWHDRKEAAFQIGIVGTLVRHVVGRAGLSPSAGFSEWRAAPNNNHYKKDTSKGTPFFLTQVVDKGLALHSPFHGPMGPYSRSLCFWHPLVWGSCKSSTRFPAASCQLQKHSLLSAAHEVQRRALPTVSANDENCVTCGRRALAMSPRCPLQFYWELKALLTTSMTAGLL